MIPRRTPLVRKTPLRATLVARAGHRRTPFVPKRPRVTPEERKARAGVRARSGGWCELGILCSGLQRATDWSHRVSRSQGGPWDVANGGHACRGCHSWAQTHPALARARTGWILRSTDDYRAIPVLHARHGRVHLRSDGGIEQATKEAA